jgi:hypothetical protein
MGLIHTWQRTVWNRAMRTGKGNYYTINTMLGGVSVTTAWRVLGLRMEEQPPAMEVSCDYIE